MNPVTEQVTAAGNTLVVVAAVAMLAAGFAAYLAVTAGQRRTTRAAQTTRPARGRRRADGPAVRGPRRLDRIRDNLRDDTDRLAGWVSARRRERAAAAYQARVLEQRTGIPAGGAR